MSLILPFTSLIIVQTLLVHLERKRNKGKAIIAVNTDCDLQAANDQMSVAIAITTQCITLLTSRSSKCVLPQ